MAIPELDSLLGFYFEQGLSHSSHSSYKSGIKKFQGFCAAHNITSPFPISQSLLCYYITYLAKLSLSPATIKVYLSALRHSQVALGLPAPDRSSMPMLKLVQRGIERTRASTGLNPSRPPRLPITPAILLGIHQYWAPRRSDVDYIMLWAACSTAFFGFFRLGELTVPSDTAFDPSRHLSPADVSIDSRDSPSLVRLFLKASKTDQLREGVPIFLYKANSPLCPVAALTAYIAVRGQTPGPFFRFQDSRPLTQDRFIAPVRDALLYLGLHSANYSCHSFRIGAATTAAERGIEDSTIQALGRWRSDAFRAYVRIPRENLAVIASVMGACQDPLSH